MRRLTATIAVTGVICVALTGCVPPSSNDTAPPAPSFTEVPTTSPTPTPGKDVPLATTTTRGIADPVYISVWDVDTWKTASGCGCKAPGESMELYPAGSVAWTIKIDLDSSNSWARDEGFDASQMTFTPSWGPGAPVPVEAPEGETRSTNPSGVGWGFASAQTPTLFPRGETRSFLMSFYVPRGAVDLNLKLQTPSKGSRWTTDPIVISLDVPVPQSVIDLVYAGPTGE